MTTSELELILRGGRVIDPAQGIDGVMDVGILGGRVATVAPALAPAPRTKMINVRGKLVLPGLIDTHAHIYEHVTGMFGLNADLVGIRSGVTTVVDQGGASPLTFNGFRNFVAQPAKSRVLSFISIYLAGGLMGHSHAGLYGPHGIDVGATVRAIEENRDLVKGIKTHAEIGGYSRWGIEVLKLAKEASRRARVPVYVHLGGMWPVVKESEPDPDSILNQVLPLLDEGDVLAHPFTRHPGAFVAASGKVHPIVTEAVMRGVRIDVGRGVHFSIEKARIVLEAGIMPFTLGADLHGYAVKRVKADAADAVPAPKGRRSRGNGEQLTATFNLHQAMSELLALGIPLGEVVSMVTSNAAVLLGLDGQIGTLAPGAVADVSVVRLERGDWTVRDASGVELRLAERIRPDFALREGVMYKSNSPLVPEVITAAA
ncbi:MAG: dihydroorotase [Candidatus Rokubacteria bacterium 13_2_20CM_69_10]|nr:MAG: dihydroorotase [Candidatus Rokubacteria bacterium 13_2_20CM_69_10]